MSETYKKGESAGVAFAALPFRTVVVTDEVLDVSEGIFEDEINYSAIVKDDLGSALPAAFVVDLEINGTNVITGQVLDATVYNPATFVLTLLWTVPDLSEGNYTVKLVWARQTV